MISTIIFDAEGVVIDSELIWDKEQEAFLKRRGCTYERENIKHLVTGKSLYESTAIINQIYKLNENLDKMVIERKILISQLLETEIDFIDGFQTFISQVLPAYKVCIATSLDRSLLSLIDRKLNLSDFFGTKLFSISDINCMSKPSPDIFLHAAVEMQSDPIECLVIEDSPYGVEAAKRANMKTIALATTYEIKKLEHANFIFEAYKDIDISLIKTL